MQTRDDTEARSSTTRDRLLDAAESLYADQGIDATSLRAITAAAGANLAAVHYHFGSKEALTEAVLRRRVEPLNRERIKRLDALESEAHGAPITLDAILEAWLAPALELGRAQTEGGGKFVRLMGRVYSEPGPYLRDLVGQLFDEVFRRFTSLLSHALPELPRCELIWRVHFLLGSLIHTIADPGRIGQLSDGLCDASDIDDVLARLIRFAAGGLQAPLPPGGIHGPGAQP